MVVVVGGGAEAATITTKPCDTEPAEFEAVTVTSAKPATNGFSFTVEADTDADTTDSALTDTDQESITPRNCGPASTSTVGPPTHERYASSKQHTNTGDTVESNTRSWIRTDELPAEFVAVTLTA